MHIFQTRPDIQQMFARLNDEHFNGEVPEIPVLWNTRMTTTAGYCRYRNQGLRYMDKVLEPYQIDLSDKLFKNNGYDLAKIERTLIHEMVHAYLLHKHNEKGHTARFQRMMTEITGEYKNHRCHSYDTEGLRRRQERKIEVHCSNCGVIGHRVRMPKANRRYLCRACRGNVTFSRIEG